MAEMATPVAPRAKGAPPAVSGPVVADLQIELRLWWKGKTRAERAAMVRGLDGIMEAAWDVSSPGEREAFTRHRLDPRMNGTASDTMALIEQSARVKRKTRDADTLRLCEMIEGRA
jgi:hypothetical protein